MSGRNEVTLAFAGGVRRARGGLRFLWSALLQMNYLAMWHQKGTKGAEPLRRPTRGKLLALLRPWERWALLRCSRPILAVETPSLEQVTSVLAALVDVELLFGCQAVFGAGGVLHRV